jgi:hypothetical protein
MPITYSPIQGRKDIRLIELKPGLPTDPIHCTLHPTSLSSNTQYQALSYTWGKATDGFKRIHVDDEAVQVGANLYNALKALREPTSERRLWIDSLCINQADEYERSQQVQRMNQIYSYASEVLIWLGKESGNSNLAMAAMLKISHITSIADLEERRLVVDYKRHRAAWTAIGKLCGRRYWQRMWIIQEVQLARTLRIFCGNKEISWSALKATLDLASRCLACKEMENEQVLLDVANSLAARLETHRLKRESRGSTLKELLYDCRESLCTDPRDKIYALLSLANDFRSWSTGVWLSLIDYSKSLGQVYGDVMSLNSLRKFKDSEIENGRDVVRFSCFLQNLLQPTLEQRMNVSLDLTIEDSEPIWLIGYLTSTILYTRQPYNNAALKMSAPTTRRVSNIIDGMFMAIKDRTPKPEDFWEGIATSSGHAIEITAAEIQQVTLDSGQSAVAILEARKEDMICRFFGCDMAVVLRSGPGGLSIIGTALFLEDSNFELEKPVYLRFNNVVLQKITAARLI